jgi:hypothetical protein
MQPLQPGGSAGLTLYVCSLSGKRAGNSPCPTLPFWTEKVLRRKQSPDRARLVVGVNLLRTRRGAEKAPDAKRLIAVGSIGEDPVAGSGVHLAPVCDEQIADCRLASHGIRRGRLALNLRGLCTRPRAIHIERCDSAHTPRYSERFARRCSIAVGDRIYGVKLDSSSVRIAHTESSRPESWQLSLPPPCGQGRESTC